MTLIERQCGCIYDPIIESYVVLCKYHSLDGLINFMRAEEFKTMIREDKART